jgi:ketosteroid isomerase-like protein
MDSQLRPSASARPGDADEDAPPRDPRAAVVDALYVALAQGDLDAALRRLAPALAWEEGWGAARPIAVHRARRSPDEEARLRAALADLARVQVIRVTAAGPEVAALVADGFAVTAAGQATRRFAVHLWTLDDDLRVTRFRRVANVGAPRRH